MNFAKIRNLEADVGESDKNEIDRDVKAVFLSDTKDSAIERFNRFKDKWSSRYPRPVYNMEKEIRIVKVIDTLPSESGAMKIIYLRVAELNEKWSHEVKKLFRIPL